MAIVLKRIQNELQHIANIKHKFCYIDTTLAEMDKSQAQLNLVGQSLFRLLKELGVPSGTAIREVQSFLND